MTRAEMGQGFGVFGRHGASSPAPVRWTPGPWKNHVLSASIEPNPGWLTYKRLRASSWRWQILA